MGFFALGIPVIISGAAFAALQSQQVEVTGNSIQTANASIQLSTDDHDYYNSLTGYAFNDMIPGMSPIPYNGYPVYLRNGGSINLAIKVSLSRPVTNPQSVDLSKVHLILSPYTGGVPQNITLKELVDSYDSGGVALTNATASRLAPNQSVGYGIQMSMDLDAINGPSASLTDIDLSFGATAVN